MILRFHGAYSQIICSNQITTQQPWRHAAFHIHTADRVGGTGAKQGPVAYSCPPSRFIWLWWWTIELVTAFSSNHMTWRKLDSVHTGGQCNLVPVTLRTFFKLVGVQLWVGTLLYHHCSYCNVTEKDMPLFSKIKIYRYYKYLKACCELQILPWVDASLPIF